MPERSPTVREGPVPEPAARGRRSRRVAAGAALVILAAGAVLGWLWFQDSARRRQGLQAARQGRFAQAAPLLRATLDRHPRDVEVLRELAAAELATGAFEAAEEHLDRWCELRPREVEPLLLRLDLWQRNKRLPDAIADARRILDLQPDNLELRKHLTSWLVLTGEFEAAEKECRRCLERSPGDPLLAYRLAESYRARGRLAEAEAAIGPVLKTQPRFAPGLLVQAMIYQDGHKPRQAIPLLRQVLEQDKSLRAIALHQLALALAEADEKEEAQKALAELSLLQALDLRTRELPESPGMLIRLAEGLAGVGREEEAVDLLARLTAREPRCGAAHQLLADLYERQGKTADAARHRQAAGLVADGEKGKP